MFDYAKIFARFMLMAGLGREEALPFEPLLLDAAAWLEKKLKPDIDILEYEGQLCSAAAAKALASLRLMEREGQFKVGDVSVTAGDSGEQARAFLEECLADVACCLRSEPVLMCVGQEENSAEERGSEWGFSG